MDITKMSITELKALAYDTIGELERVQNNLKQINNIIATKIAEANNGTKLPETIGQERVPEEEVTETGGTNAGAVKEFSEAK